MWEVYSLTFEYRKWYIVLSEMIVTQISLKVLCWFHLQMIERAREESIEGNFGPKRGKIKQK
jgi:hypothetical protein